MQKVDEALALASRAGVKDGVIFGIGSGPAMDLAKALSARLHDGDGTLILAPATLGGMYAASSPQMLLLDTSEEMLLPQSSDVKADVAYDANEQEVTYDATVVQTEVNANAYKEQRAAEYPSLSEQLDYIYHNGVEAWKTNMIQPVKDKYPKPTE